MTFDLALGWVIWGAGEIPVHRIRSTSRTAYMDLEMLSETFRMPQKATRVDKGRCQVPPEAPRFGIGGMSSDVSKLTFSTSALANPGRPFRVSRFMK